MKQVIKFPKKKKSNIKAKVKNVVTNPRFFFAVITLLVSVTVGFALYLNGPVTQYTEQLSNLQRLSQLYGFGDQLRFPGMVEEIEIKAQPANIEDIVALLRLEVENALILDFIPAADMVMLPACENGEAFIDNKVCADIANPDGFTSGQTLGTLKLQWLEGDTATIRYTDDNGYFDNQDVYSVDIEPLVIALDSELPMTGNFEDVIDCPAGITRFTNCIGRYGFYCINKDSNVKIYCNDIWAAPRCYQCTDCLYKDPVGSEAQVSCKATSPSPTPIYPTFYNSNCPANLCADNTSAGKNVCNSNKTHYATCTSTGAVMGCKACDNCSINNNVATCGGDSVQPTNPVINWDCSKSLYNGHQFKTCSSGNLYWCEGNGDKKMQECDSSGCKSNPDGVHDVCNSSLTPTPSITSNPIITKTPVIPGPTQKPAEPTILPTPPSGKMQCGATGCKTDSDCMTGLPNYECDEEIDDWPKNNKCVILCPQGQERVGDCECRTGSENKVACGKIDVDDNDKLDYIDLSGFIKFYNKECIDSAAIGGCGKKDTNNDGIVNFIDLQNLVSRYHTKRQSCRL